MFTLKRGILAIPQLTPTTSNQFSLKNNLWQKQLVASVQATVLLFSSHCAAIVVDLDTLYQDILSTLHSDLIATKHISADS